MVADVAHALLRAVSRLVYSLDAADTSVRATYASINADGGPPHSAPQTVLAESKGYPLGSYWRT